MKQITQFILEGETPTLSWSFHILRVKLNVPKINSCFSRPSKVDNGVPQDLSLGPLLFNINLINMFYEFEASNIENYADDTTLYTCTLDSY